MTAELCDLPLYDGLGDINTFFRDYERRVPECRKLLVLDQALRAAPVKWWVTHKKNIRYW